MENDNKTNDQSGTTGTQAENERTTAPTPTTISALSNYRKAREAERSGESPTPSQQSQREGESGPDAGQESESPQDHREQFIPRTRFDEVVQQKNEREQQLNQLQTQMQQFMAQMQNAPQQPQQPREFVGPTGMVHPQPQQAPQPQPQDNLPNFDDPKVAKEWQQKIARDPIKGMREFVDIMIQRSGRPLLEQYANQINERLSPLQQAVVSQQVNQYAQQRSSDPEFQQIRPVFQQLAKTTAERGFDITNPQVMEVVEYVAKQQARTQNPYMNSPMGMPQQQMPMQMPPQPMPFSERPGNSGQAIGNQKPRRTLTPEQKQYARKFNMSEERYAAQLDAMGVQ